MFKCCGKWGSPKSSTSEASMMGKLKNWLKIKQKKDEKNEPSHTEEVNVFSKLFAEDDESSVMMAKELWDAVGQGPSALKTVLAREDVRSYGNLGRKAWIHYQDPLHYAAWYGWDDRIRMMHEAGFDVDSYRYGDGDDRATSLHQAVLNNQPSTVKLLLELGADWTLKGKYDCHCSGTPLDWAKQTGNWAVARLLREHVKERKKNGNKTETRKKNDDKLTMIDKVADKVFIRWDRYQVREENLERLMDGWTEEEGRFDAPVSLEKEMWDAVAEGLPALKAVLGREDVKKHGNLGRKEWRSPEDPLHFAAWYGNNDMIRLMYDAGFDVSSHRRGDGVDFATSLHQAVLAYQPSTVKLLLDLGADWNLEGKYDRHCSGTPLDWARQTGHSDIVKMLEKHAVMHSFITMDPATKVAQKSEKVKELEEAMRIHEEVSYGTSLLHNYQKEIWKTEQVLKELNKAITKQQKYMEENKLEDQRSVIFVLKKQLEEIATIESGEVRKPSGQEKKNCPICFMSLRQVFSCQDCDNWVCQDCVERVVACPTCRADLTLKPMRRNRAAERMMQDD